MKKLFLILLTIVMVISASAQHKYTGGHYYRPGTRVVVGLGYGAFYPYRPIYPYGYGYWNYPPYYRPSRLELEIEDIRNDYKDRIWSARHDDNLSKQQKKKTIHELKHQREEAILSARKNYYRSY